MTSACRTGWRRSTGSIVTRSVVTSWVSPPYSIRGANRARYCSKAVGQSSSVPSSRPIRWVTKARLHELPDGSRCKCRSLDIRTRSGGLAGDGGPLGEGPAGLGFEVGGHGGTLLVVAIGHPGLRCREPVVAVSL